MANDKQIIYSMSKVGKVYNQKHVLKDISLGYYYGAKISSSQFIIIVSIVVLLALLPCCLAA